MGARVADYATVKVEALLRYCLGMNRLLEAEREGWSKSYLFHYHNQFLTQALALKAAANRNWSHVP
jgi:hypothetical protein